MNDPTEQGLQYCKECDKETNHIPKLDLVFEGKRLCEVCRTSNYTGERKKIEMEQDTERPISEAPEKWVIVNITSENPLLPNVYKVFGTWAGGYLDGDRWKLNSGIVKVEEDDDFYYFYGYSGSCYQCAKGAYGFMTSYGQSVLEGFIERAADAEYTMTIADEDTDWMTVVSD